MLIGKDVRAKIEQVWHGPRAWGRRVPRRLSPPTAQPDPACDWQVEGTVQRLSASNDRLHRRCRALEAQTDDLTSLVDGIKGMSRDALHGRVGGTGTKGGTIPPAACADCGSRPSH